MNNSVATLDHVPADRRSRAERQPEGRPLVMASNETPRRWLVVDHAGVHPVFAWALWATALADARLCVLERARGSEVAA